MADRKELQALITLAGKVDPSLKNALKQAQDDSGKTSKSMGKLGGIASSAMKTIKKSVMAVGASILASTGLSAAGIGQLINNVADSADQLEKMRVTTGLTYEELQRLKFVSGQLSVNFESVQGAIGIMTKNMSSAKKSGSEAANAFKALGIEVKGTNGQLRPQSEIFKESLVALSDIQNVSERNALAFKVFGRGASELFPILDAGTGEVQRLAAQADKLGIVLGNEQVAAAENFGDTMDQVKLVFSGLGNQIAAKVIPIIQPFLENIISKTPEIQAAVIPVIDNILNTIVNGAPAVIDNIGEIFNKAKDVYNFISNNWSTLKPTIIGVASAVGLYKIAMLGATEETKKGLIIQALAKAWAAAKKAIDMLRRGEALMTIVQKGLNAAWRDNPIGLVCTAIGILIGLGTLLYQNWDTISKAIVGVWQNYVMPFFNGIGAWFSGVWNGVVNAFKTVWSGLTGWFKGLWDGIISIAKGAANLLISPINWLIKGLNSVSFKVPDWVPDWLGGGKTFGIKIPEIPTFARGGFANQPSIFGEAGPEMAIPIKYKNPRSLSLLNQTARAIGADTTSSGGSPIFYFSPIIHGGNSSEVKAMLEEEYSRFKDMIDQYFEEKARVSFGQ